MSVYQKVPVDDENNVAIVDLRSDTLTKPTPSMWAAMSSAEVGDDVYGEDPTVNELEEKTARLLAKEAALFVPSGTMGNLLAMMVHCNKRSSETIVGSQAHTFLFEQGGAAHLAGVYANQIRNNPDGTFDLDEFVEKIRGEDFHEPKTSLVMIENTHNICGGRVLPLDWVERLSELAHERGLKVHMDGARVFNAASFLGLPVSRVVRDVDSVCFCLSKGLGCPVGSMLCGSKAFIDEARRYRKALGGGMRQIGILAAAALVALEEVVPLLKQDHVRAKKLAQAIFDLGSPNVTIDVSKVQTNILMVEILNPELNSSALTQRLARVEPREIEAGVVDAAGKGVAIKCGARDSRTVRMVTHIGIGDDLLDLAVRKMAFVVREVDESLGK